MRYNVSSRTVSIQSLTVNGSNISSTKIADALGKVFENISSDNNYYNEFQIYKGHQETVILDFLDQNMAAYNSQIAFSKLENAFSKGRGTSTGEYKVSYEMFSNVGAEIKLCLLQIFNKIWLEDTIAWKNEIVVPILKPRKS